MELCSRVRVVVVSVVSAQPPRSRPTNPRIVKAKKLIFILQNKRINGPVWMGKFFRRSCCWGLCKLGSVPNSFESAALFLLRCSAAGRGFNDRPLPEFHSQSLPDSVGLGPWNDSCLPGG